ncbi:putative transcription repressor PLATZ family [Dioscorea sansibarensis]
MQEEQEVEKQWPVWLQPLLQTNFFIPCDDHSSDSQKMECNMYCLDCISGALCALCLSHHSDHDVVQIRRSSYHDVIRVSEIQRVLDVSGVQTYIINSARVVFLNERPQIRAGKGINNNCLVCDRSLVDTFRYCSIGCKVKAESKKCRKKGGSSNVVAPRSPRPRRPSGSNDPQVKSSVKSNAAGSGQASARPPSRRRKGIPHRAPFGIFAA